MLKCSQITETLEIFCVNPLIDKRLHEKCALFEEKVYCLSSACNKHKTASVFKTRSIVKNDLHDVECLFKLNQMGI